MAIENRGFCLDLFFIYLNISQVSMSHQRVSFLLLIKVYGEVNRISLNAGQARVIKSLKL